MHLAEPPFSCHRFATNVVTRHGMEDKKSANDQYTEDPLQSNMKIRKDFSQATYSKKLMNVI
jgi:hypothetical protein